MTESLSRISNEAFLKIVDSADPPTAETIALILNMTRQAVERRLNHLRWHGLAVRLPGRPAHYVSAGKYAEWQRSGTLKPG